MLFENRDDYALIIINQQIYTQIYSQIKFVID
jgi:vacuolar-type H+-ATPase subunit F/Vma7